MKYYWAAHLRPGHLLPCMQFLNKKCNKTKESKTLVGRWGSLRYVCEVYRFIFLSYSVKTVCPQREDMTDGVAGSVSLLTCMFLFWEHFWLFSICGIRSRASINIIYMSLKNVVICTNHTRPPYLPPEKLVCRSRSNSYNLTWNNGPVQNWERSTSKLRKEYVKAVYCHPAYLTYMQSTSCEILAWG